MIDNLREASEEESREFYSGGLPCMHSEDPDPFASLETGERATYAAVIDDILEKRGKEAVTGVLVLERLQERLHRDLASQRYAIKLLIIERLRKQPVPQTVASFDECDSDPSSVTARKATVTAFNVPELLESILSHLPIEDLFASSRVNKTFHRLIATSPTLQRKMFLLPEKGQPQKWQSIRNTVTHRVHAEVASSSNDHSALTWPEAVLEGRWIAAHSSPLLVPEEWRVPPAPAPEWDSVSAKRLDKRILESESWPQMYLTDPPCTCACIDIEYVEKLPTGAPSLRVRRHVSDPAGVTLGALHETLHAKGIVAVEERPYYRNDLGLSNFAYSAFHGLRIVPDTTIGELLQNLERKGFKLSPNPETVDVQFCHLYLPSEAEFEEMRRNGRVEGHPPLGTWW